MIYNHITELIGNTPLLKIDPSVHGLHNIDLYAKLEYYNPFGSVKDRVAWSMIKDDIAEIKEKELTILESSSGNTAKALQALASIHDIPFKTITNRIKVPEVKHLLQIMGARIEELPGKSECPDPNNPDDALSHIEKHLRQESNKYFYTSQYTNEKNTAAHYKTTGQELYDDLGTVDCLIGGLGTTGSTLGVSRFLKEKNPALLSIGVVSSSGDYIPGIRTNKELWEVGLFERSSYATIETVTSLEAIEGMVTLIRKCGMLAGPTTGANYEGALKYLRCIDKTIEGKKIAVFIACDRFEHYISYIRERKPELLEEPAKHCSLRSITESELQQAPSLTPSDAATWISQTSPLIIDIRSNLAYKAAHIPTSINISSENFEDMVEGFHPFPQGQNLLLVCPVGEQSKRFAIHLKKEGYTVYNLSSGITGWRDAGLPLEKNAKQ